MSREHRLQILIPVFYLLLTCFAFVVTIQKIGLQNQHAVGIILTIPPFLLWIIARVQLGEAFSLRAKAKFLVTTGLYSKFRHPVYYFSVIALFGIVIFYNSIYLLLIWVMFLVLQLIRIKKEEKILISKFGKTYTQYSKTTWI